MKLLLAVVAWVVIALAIGIGMVLAVKGSPWLLLLSMLGFILAFARYGCIEH